MALQNFKCPNCGGEVQMDDNLEKGFCMYCGGAIHIKEEVAKIKVEHSGKVSVEHSGKVQVDDTKKLTNSIELADRAFKAGNYSECYNYCCSALECDINNFRIIFRKGLCAAYISPSRIGELEQAIKASMAIINRNPQNVIIETHIVFSETFEYVKSIYTLDCERPKGFIYPDFAAANNTFSVVAGLTALCAVCADLISNEMISVHPTFENDKKLCLEQGLKLCKLGKSSFKYIAGYEQVKKDDSYVQEEIHETVKSPFIDMQKNYETKFKNDFNNLPTTKKALMEYDGEIAKLQKDIYVFEQKLEAYFEANPEIGKLYKKKAVPFIIFTAVAFGVCLIVATLAEVLPTILFALIMSFLSLATVGLGVLTVVKLITNSKNRRRILNSLPQELSCLRSTYEQSKIRLQAVKQTKAEFVKKNVKK